MDIVSTTRERIFAAADALYEKAGRSEFPTVDAVRKSARVNMNDANAGMREWRRLQMSRAAPVAVQVPDAVQIAANLALGSLGKTAQELANESLAVAQAGWERDRAEADTLNRQLADAYESQSADLLAAQSEVARLESAAATANVAMERLQSDLSAKRHELLEAKVAKQRAEVRCVEIERRADDLRTELNHAHDEVAAARAELATVTLAHAAEAEELRNALIMAKSKNETAAESARELAREVNDPPRGSEKRNRCSLLAMWA